MDFHQDRQRQAIDIEKPDRFGNTIFNSPPPAISSNNRLSDNIKIVGDDEGRLPPPVASDDDLTKIPFIPPKTNGGFVDLGVGILSPGVIRMNAPPSRAKRVKLTNADVTVLAFMGLIFVATLSREAMIKGLLSVAFGLFLSTVGIDPITGLARYTFGIPELLCGFDFISAMIGLFAIAVVFSDMKDVYKPALQGKNKARISLRSIGDFFRRWKALGVGVMWAAIMGPIPGVGSVASTWISYSFIKGRSKEPE